MAVPVEGHPCGGSHDEVYSQMEEALEEAGARETGAVLVGCHGQGPGNT